MSDVIGHTRIKYLMSSTAMAHVCGFGTNQWRNYENGSEPCVSNALMIELVKDPRVFLRLLFLRREGLSDKQFKKSLEAALKLITDEAIEKAQLSPGPDELLYLYREKMQQVVTEFDTFFFKK